MLAGGLRKRLGQFVMHYTLRKAKRKRQFYNIHTASYAGVIFYLSEQTMSRYQDILDLLAYFRSHDLRLFTCCYYDGKTIPLPLLQDKRINVFCQHDLRFLCFPKRPYSDYLNKEFDLLIDLSLEDSLPLHYMGALSRAKCKVGNIRYGKEKYDILIDTSKNDDNFAFYVAQVKHFASSIQ